MASTATVSSANNQHVITALKALQDDTGMTIDHLIEAAENNNLQEFKRLAADVFSGDPTSLKRAFSLYNDALQGIGHNAFSITNNRHDSANTEEKEKNESEFFQILESIRITQEIIKDVQDAIAKEMQESEARIAALDSRANALDIQITEIDKKIEVIKSQEKLNDDIEETSGEIETAKKELAELEKKQEDTKETLAEEQEKFSKLKKEIVETESYLEEMKIQDRHTYMASKYSGGGLGKKESIVMVSLDDSRIVKFNGQFVSYDVDTNKLTYKTKDPETGETITQDVPPSEVASIWKGAYENDLIFANESIKHSSPAEFFKTYEASKTFTTDKLCESFKDASEQQKSIIAKISAEIGENKLAIKAKNENINTQLEKLRALEEKVASLANQFNASGADLEQLEKIKTKLVQEKIEVSEEILRERKELEILREAHTLMSSPQAAKRLYEAIYNDDQKLITREELESLTKGMSEGVKEKLLDALKTHDIEVETQHQEIASKHQASFTDAALHTENNDLTPPQSAPEHSVNIENSLNS